MDKNLMASPASFLLLGLLLLLPILYLFLFWSNRRLSNKVRSVPELPLGPAKLPIIGNLHQLTGGSNIHRSLWELSKKHGPVMHLKLGRVHALVVSSSAAAKEVLKTHDLDCADRPISTPAFKFSYGYSGIAFAPYGDRWKERRRICREEFLSGKKVASLKSAVEEETDRTMRWMASRTMKDSPVVDVSDSSRFLFNSVICRTAFGKSCHDSGGKRFYGVLDETQAVAGGFFLGDYFPLLAWMDVLTGMRGRLQKTFLELQSFLQQLIKEHEEHDHRGDLLDALLRARDAKDLTDSEMKAVLMDVFSGGTDTSSSIVEWAMAQLMRHPEVMRRAQDEVRSVVGRKGKVEESDLRQLRYLKAVIKETMRLHPPAPLLIPRESIRGFKLQGYHVAPKTTIFVNVFAIGRDPASWERPEEFLPERFMVEQSSSRNSTGLELSSHHDFKLLPFGEGRRICLGMNLGLLMTELGLASLLYCFDWSLPAGVAAEDIDMGEAIGITVHRSTPLCLVATKYGVFQA